MPELAKINTAQNPKSATKDRVHTIAKGDTLSELAVQYGVKLKALQVANPGLDPKKLRIGDKLSIPHCESELRLPAAPEKLFYKIQAGDTLSEIATRFPGVSTQDLRKANPDLEDRALQIGHKILIPTPQSQQHLKQDKDIRTAPNYFMLTNHLGEKRLCFGEKQLTLEDATRYFKEGKLSEKNNGMTIEDLKIYEKLCRYLGQPYGPVYPQGATAEEASFKTASGRVIKDKEVLHLDCTHIIYQTARDCFGVNGLCGGEGHTIWSNAGLELKATISGNNVDFGALDLKPGDICCHGKPYPNEAGFSAQHNFVIGRPVFKDGKRVDWKVINATGRYLNKEQTRYRGEVEEQLLSEIHAKYKDSQERPNIYIGRFPQASESKAKTPV